MIQQSLSRTPTVISGGDHAIRRVAWCTGGAQNWIHKAAEAGVDAYISGEISEHTVHVAREMGVHYIAAGHHATERYGALGIKLSKPITVRLLSIKDISVGVVLHGMLKMGLSAALKVSP